MFDRRSAAVEEVPFTSTVYMVDLHDGTIQELPYPGDNLEVIPDTVGNRYILIRDAYEIAPHIELWDPKLNELSVIYDADRGVDQWARDDRRDWGHNSSYDFFVQANWLSADTLALTIRVPEIEDLAEILLVHPREKGVEVLSPTGKILAQSPGGALVWQAGGIGGELFLLPPPYNGQPVLLSAAGLWKTDVAVSSNSQKVAWFESEAPPGDWSRSLPRTCLYCNGSDSGVDPVPALKALVVWDGAISQVERFTAPSNVIWHFATANSSSNPERFYLYWLRDNETVLYAASARDDASEQFALYQMDMKGQATVVAKFAWYGDLVILWVGEDNSIYFEGTELIYQDDKWYTERRDVFRWYADELAALFDDAAHYRPWQVDRHGYLVALKDKGVEVFNIISGEKRRAQFARGEFGLGWTSVLDIVPLSPDGSLAAFAGSGSDLIQEGDRGQEILIERVK